MLAAVLQWHRRYNCETTYILYTTYMYNCETTYINLLVPISLSSTMHFLPSGFYPRPCHPNAFPLHCLNLLLLPHSLDLTFSTFFICYIFKHKWKIRSRYTYWATAWRPTYPLSVCLPKSSSFSTPLTPLPSTPGVFVGRVKYLSNINPVAVRELRPVFVQYLCKYSPPAAWHCTEGWSTLRERVCSANRQSRLVGW